jgi:hypothetical protein
MKFKFSALVNDNLSCNLCLDYIDAVLGYFDCSSCMDTYCRECAVDRDRNETEMAENPFVIATPMQDIMRNSIIGNKSFNGSIYRELNINNVLDNDLQAL